MYTNGESEAAPTLNAPHTDDVDESGSALAADDPIAVAMRACKGTPRLVLVDSPLGEYVSQRRYILDIDLSGQGTGIQGCWVIPNDKVELAIDLLEQAITNHEQQHRNKEEIVSVKLTHF